MSTGAYGRRDGKPLTHHLLPPLPPIRIVHRLIFLRKHARQTGLWSSSPAAGFFSWSVHAEYVGNCVQQGHLCPARFAGRRRCRGRMVPPTEKARSFSARSDDSVCRAGGNCGMAMRMPLTESTLCPPEMVDHRSLLRRVRGGLRQHRTKVGPPTSSAISPKARPIQIPAAFHSRLRFPASPSRSARPGRIRAAPLYGRRDGLELLG